MRGEHYHNPERRNVHAHQRRSRQNNSQRENKRADPLVHEREDLHNHGGEHQRVPGVVVRPANRRNLQHHERGQRQLRHERAGTNQRNQQNRGDQHNQQGQRHLHHGQSGRRQVMLQARVGQRTHNRHVIEIAEPTHTRSVTHRVEPERQRLLTNHQKADTHGRGEARTQGRNALPVLTHEQQQTERERGQLNTRRNTQQHAARNAGRRAHKIGKNQRQNDGVNLPKMRGQTPRTAHPNQRRNQRHHTPMTQVLLQRQTPRTAPRVGVQQVRAPVAERANNGGNQQHALRFGEERERVEEQRRKRRVRERQAARAEGVQLVAVRAVREGDGAQAVHVNIVSRRVRHVVEGVEGNQDEQQVRPESAATHAGDAVKEAATRRLSELLGGFFGDFFLCRFFRGGYRGCGKLRAFSSAFSSRFRNRCSSRARRSPRDYRRGRLGILRVRNGVLVSILHEGLF